MTGFCRSCNVKHFTLFLVSVYSIQSRKHLFQQLLSQCKGKGTILAAVPGSNTYNLRVLVKCLNRMSLKSKSAWFNTIYTSNSWPHANGTCKFSLLFMMEWKMCTGICLPFGYTSVWICNCEEAAAASFSPSICEIGGLITFLSSSC